MTETTKTVFEKYQVRKTKAQKTAFIEYVKEIAGNNSYPCRVEVGKGSKPRNIVIGDPDSAKVVFTAHYDTCPRLPFPNFITPKNIFVYILYQLLLTCGILLLAGVVGFISGIAMGLLKIDIVIASMLGGWLVYIFVFVILFLMMFGPANPHTANDNTSGVTVILDTMQALPEELRSKAAFVFFDMEEVGLVGSSAFYSAHKAAMKDKLLINFDCVSDGEHILFATKKKALCYEELLSSSFVSNEKYTVDIASKGVIYPSDQAKFPLGIGVAALKKSKKLGILYMDKIHTKKDTVYNEENIEFLVNGAVKLSRDI